MAMHGAVERDNKPDAEIIAGKILSLIASGEARSRLELAEVAGLSRSTIAERLAVLFRRRLISKQDAWSPPL